MSESFNTPSHSAAPNGVPLHFNGHALRCLNGESVLDALLRQQQNAPHSCKKGSCRCCLLRSTDDYIPELAQQSLKDTQRDKGYFLACQCYPDKSLSCELPELDENYKTATVVDMNFVTDNIVILTLVATPFDYRPGQFVNLRRPNDGLIRSYSLARKPSASGQLELHVKKMNEGLMSQWIFSELLVGDKVDIYGPEGDCHYLESHGDSPLLLIGTGTGLSPLLGIVRDALDAGHAQEIYLYHGSRNAENLYCVDQLVNLQRKYSNFYYNPCLSGDDASETLCEGLAASKGRADQIALRDHSQLEKYKIFLCGHPDMVKSTKTTFYLQGADLANIYADPFYFSESKPIPSKK